MVVAGSWVVLALWLVVLSSVGITTIELMREKKKEEQKLTARTEIGKSKEDKRRRLSNE